MNQRPPELTCVVEVGAGETLTLPRSLLDRVGPGRWLIIVRPLPANTPTRDHTAFLRSYGPEDEDLYDDSAAE